MSEIVDLATRNKLAEHLEVLAPYVGTAEYVDRLRAAVVGLKSLLGEPLKTSIGHIVLLGMWHNGRARVQFNDVEGNTYPSDWNEYLFKIAREAYFRNLRVVVLSAGAPVGDNILVVSLVQGI